MVTSTFLLPLVASWSLLFRTTRAQCYYPDGSPTPAFEGFVRCSANTSDRFTSCCSPTDACTTNGLCKSYLDQDTNLLFRYGCTDPNWKSPNCAQICKNSPSSKCFCIGDAHDACGLVKLI
jgi:hypothetical protein